MMRRKLYVSEEQVSVGHKPVTGLRLRLKVLSRTDYASKCSIWHLFQRYSNPTGMRISQLVHPCGRGQRSRTDWFEPVKWKNFSHSGTAPVEYHETLIRDISGVYIVTGAHLGMWDFGSKKVLYMKLVYSKVPGCTIRRSLWDHNPATSGNQSTSQILTDSPEPRSSGAGLSDAGKLVKIVDMSEMCKGPDDLPGHWLVAGGKLAFRRARLF